MTSYFNFVDFSFTEKLIPRNITIKEDILQEQSKIFIDKIKLEDTDIYKYINKIYSDGYTKGV